MLSRWVRNRSNATAIAYGLVAGIAALALIAGTGSLPPKLEADVTEITGSIPSRPGLKRDREPVTGRAVLDNSVVLR